MKAVDRPTLFRGDDVVYQARFETEGRAGLAWMTAREGARLWGGLAQWDGAVAPPKTLDYEEILYVLSGEFGIKLENGTTLIGMPGDLLHIPQGSTVRYQGKKATVLFVVTSPDAAA